MSKHTKGPWHIHACGGSVWSDDCKVADTMHVNQAHGYRIPCASERESNARLIAAAPELLEALESVDREHELLGWMKTCEKRRDRGSFGIAVMSDELALEWQSHNRNLEKLIDYRRGAIAKARGKS